MNISTIIPTLELYGFWLKLGLGLLSRFCTGDSKFVSIVCRDQMVSTIDNDIYTGSGLRGVIPYVQYRAAMFPC
jgi:hypothetical protein